jgi:hypothetical protein
MTGLTLSPETERRLAAELWEGETILWCGRPKETRLAFRRFRSAVAVLAVSALLAYVFASEGSPIFAILVGGGGLLTVAHFAKTNWFGVRTYYLVTNRRMMSVGLGSEALVKWISGRELKSARFKTQPDGSGDLLFERHLTASEERAAGKGRALFDDAGPIRGYDAESVLDGDPAIETFVGVPDAKQVCDLISRTFGRS